MTDASLNAETARELIPLSKSRLYLLETVLEALFDGMDFRVKEILYDSDGTIASSKVSTIDATYARIVVGQIVNEFSNLEARIEALEAANSAREGETKST